MNKGCSMKHEYLAILRSLKQNIEELSPPLEAAQRKVYGEDEERIQSSLDLTMGELTMTVLVLMGADSEISADELELLNDMRHVVYGFGIPEFNSSYHGELCEKFVRLYPRIRLSLDHIPSSIRLLRTYDTEHGTTYAEKARNLFVQFADAVATADNRGDFEEDSLLANFKDLLNATGEY
jgi:hypothetical protein